MENVDVQPPAKFVLSLLFPCLHVGLNRLFRKSSPGPRRSQQASPRRSLPTKPYQQHPLIRQTCQRTTSPPQSQQLEEQHPWQSDYFVLFPERLVSEQRDQPVLVPKPLPSQAEKIQQAEELAGQLGVKLLVQTAISRAVQAEERRRAEAMRAASEQAVRDLGSDSSRLADPKQVRMTSSGGDIASSPADQVKSFSVQYSLYC